MSKESEVISDAVRLEIRLEADRILENTQKDAKSRLDEFEKRTTQILSLIKWGGGVAASLITIIVGLGWMVLESRVPANRTQELHLLTTRSCDAIKHGIDASRRFQEHELSDAQSQLDRVRIEKQNLTERLSDLKEAVKEKRSEVGIMDSTVAKLVAQVRAEENSEARIVIQGEYDRQDAQLTILKSDLAQSESELEDIPGDLLNLDARITKLGATITGVRASLVDLEGARGECP